MMKQMGKEQKVLITQQMQRQAVIDKRRKARLKQLKDEFVIGVAIMFIIFVMGGVFMWVAHDRQQKYPQYGNELFPKSERQRQRERETPVYIGR